MPAAQFCPSTNTAGGRRWPPKAGVKGFFPYLYGSKASKKGCRSRCNWIKVHEVPDLGAQCARRITSIPHRGDSLDLDHRSLWKRMPTSRFSLIWAGCWMDPSISDHDTMRPQMRQAMTSLPLPPRKKPINGGFPQEGPLAKIFRATFLGKQAGSRQRTGRQAGSKQAGRQAASSQAGSR